MEIASGSGYLALMFAKVRRYNYHHTSKKKKREENMIRGFDC